MVGIRTWEKLYIVSNLWLTSLRYTHATWLYQEVLSDTKGTRIKPCKAWEPAPWKLFGGKPPEEKQKPEQKLLPVFPLERKRWPVCAKMFCWLQVPLLGKKGRKKTNLHSCTLSTLFLSLCILYYWSVRWTLSFSVLRTKIRMPYLCPPPFDKSLFCSFLVTFVLC